jgi:hypothetical protein
MLIKSGLLVYNKHLIGLLLVPDKYGVAWHLISKFPCRWRTVCKILQPMGSKGCCLKKCLFKLLNVMKNNEKKDDLGIFT